MTEIKLDRTTLPKNGQKVKWQTQEDIDTLSHKEGIFIEGDDIFCVGFEEEIDEWDSAWLVLYWEEIK